MIRERAVTIGIPFAMVVGLALCGSDVHGGDWPQILGPNRTGIAVDEKIADEWPDEGPAVLWRRDVGSGFSGIAVADGLAVLFHRVDGFERVEGMDAKTGEVRWKDDAKATYVRSYNPDDGPRAVPLLHDGKAYVYGAHGVLRCLDVATGKPIWSRDAHGEYGETRPSRGEPPEGYFGIGTAPIVEGDKLILNVGGAQKQAGIVAFSLKTGDTLWKSTPERASYSAPVAATIDGRRHIMFIARFNVVSVDPENGNVRFRFPFGHPGPNVSAASPVVLGEHLFVSASYGFGAIFAKAQENEARILWESDEVMSSQYTTCVEHGGNLYGVHGRQDIGAASLRCFEPTSRKVHWTQPDFGYATLIKADGKLIIMKTDGELVLARATPTRYEELARASLFGSTTRALPALADGRLYVRDGNMLKCFNLQANN